MTTTKKKTPARKKRSTKKRPAKKAAASKVAAASAKAESAPPAKGRPAGSVTQKIVAEASPSRCPKCQSTERDKYSQTRSIAVNGRLPVAHTHVVLRWTKCKSCGQARTDRSFENRKPKADKKKSGD